MLPEVKLENPGQRYFLDIELNGNRSRIEDFRRQLVYTGALDRDLVELIKQDDMKTLQKDLDEYLNRLGFPPEVREKTILTLIDKTAYLPTDELKRGDEIVISVGKYTGEDGTGTGQTERLLRKVYQVSGDDAQTIWLELNND
jgi:hypothetical protein